MLTGNTIIHPFILLSMVNMVTVTNLLQMMFVITVLLVFYIRFYWNYHRI